jgi:hypothetical protein
MMSGDGGDGRSGPGECFGDEALVDEVGNVFRPIRERAFW